jgi:hypothetical protein
MKRMTRVILAAAAAAALPAMLRADVFIKQKYHTDPMTLMGRTQPAKDVVHETWITPQAARSDDPERSTIYRMDKNVIIILDHKKKTATEIALGQMKMPGMDMPQNKEANAAIQDMMKNMMKMKITITATGEKKKINGWNCAKYVQVMETGMGQHKSEIWATEDIKIDYELFAKFSAAMLAQMPGASAAMEDMTREMKKIKGMHVYTESSTPMMGTVVKSTIELLEWKEGKAPSGILDIPAGYRQNSLEKM